jgi:hypothetical protein
MRNKEIVSQLQSSYDFLHDLWQRTRDPKQSEQIKGELMECQEQLRRAKGGIQD